MIVETNLKATILWRMCMVNHSKRFLGVVSVPNPWQVNKPNKFK